LSRLTTHHQRRGPARPPRSCPTPATPDEVERAEYRFYLDYLGNGMVVFDAGACVGEFTLLFSRFVGHRGRVHAFEPGSVACSRLQEVCPTAGRFNVDCNRLALTDRQGSAQLHIYDDAHLSWNSLADRPLYRYGVNVAAAGTETVPTTTVDAYCDERGIDRIDLLKIDVEGAEYQVLRGAGQMLKDRRIACCVFEFSPTTYDMGNDPKRIAALLERSGYAVRNVVTGDPVFPMQQDCGAACFSMMVAAPKP